MMTCEEFTENVTEYLEGRVPYGERIGMWFHAVLCGPCKRYLEQMREVVDLCDELGEEESRDGAPEEVKDDLLEKFRHKDD